MKFWTFDSTLWAHLPRDFAENEDTAWVTCPNSLFDPQRGPDVYHQYINQLAYADQLGFDGVVINEHHQERLKQHNHISSLMTKRTEVPRQVQFSALFLFLVYFIKFFRSLPFYNYGRDREGGTSTPPTPPTAPSLSIRSSPLTTSLRTVHPFDITMIQKKVAYPCTSNGQIQSS